MRVPVMPRPCVRRAGSRLARQLDGTTVADPELPGVFWSYRFRDGALQIARKAQDKVEECIADYAFGSGRHATTFVSMIRPDIPAILEHRLSYYAHSGGLGLTPGHDIKPPPPGLTALGGVPPPRDTRACFGCHATQISAQGGPGIDEQTMIPNVSCERCHGPGRAHVEAARRGAPSPNFRCRWATAAGPRRSSCNSVAPAIVIPTDPAPTRSAAATRSWPGSSRSGFRSRSAIVRVRGRSVA